MGYFDVSGKFIFLMFVLMLCTILFPTVAAKKDNNLSNKGIDVLKGKCCGHRRRPPIAQSMSSSSPRGGAKSSCGVPEIGMVKNNICIQGPQMVADHTILKGEILMHVINYKC